MIMAITDDEVKYLILRAQAGDKEAFDKIYDLFFSKIYRYIFFRTKHNEEAEDLTSTVFLKIWQSLPRYRVRSGAKFSTWLFQIARYTLIDYYRRRKKSVSLDEIKEEKTASGIEIGAEINEVRAYVAYLPEVYQTVINLRYFQGLAYGEIAQIMGKTKVGVRVLSHRAIKKLANLMRISND